MLKKYQSIEIHKSKGTGGFKNGEIEFKTETKIIDGRRVTSVFCKAKAEGC